MLAKLDLKSDQYPGAQIEIQIGTTFIDDLPQGTFLAQTPKKKNSKGKFLS